MNRLLLVGVGLIISSPAFALDMADEGVYAAVHKDGHVTQKIMRLSHFGGRWHVDDRKQDGSWDDVTCESACELSESTPQQMAQFLSETKLDGSHMECVQDEAFAFCRTGVAVKDRSYRMVAFIEGSVIPLDWVRLDPKTLKPLAP